MRGGCNTLPHNLADQVEIVNILGCDGIIKDCAWPRIFEATILLKDHLGLHSLVYHDECELGALETLVFESNLDLVNFQAHNDWLLGLTNTIAVEDDVFRINAVNLLEGFEDLFNQCAQVLGDLIIIPLLKLHLSAILTSWLINRSAKSKHWLLTSLMVYIITDNHRGTVKEGLAPDRPGDTADFCIDLNQDLVADWSQILSSWNSLGQDNLWGDRKSLNQ